MKTEIEKTVPSNIKIEISDRRIIHTETGCYTVMPAVTVRRAREVLKKIGARAIEQIDPAYTDGVPIFRVNEASSRATCHRETCLGSIPPTYLNDPPKESYGKGMTLEQSEASAVMEAVERYCGQRFPHRQDIYANYEDVKAYALHPAEFSLPAIPLKCENCQERDIGCFSELEEVCHEWVWGYSLLKDSPVLIPSAMVYYPYISDDGISFLYNDTGGLSAGNTIEEAILQGIAEVIERDALYYSFNLENVKSMPVVTFENVKNRHLQKFINEILPEESIFVNLLSNKSLDLNIPTFSAFICYKIGNDYLYFGGSGTCLDRYAGLLRALTEMEQQKVRKKVFSQLEKRCMALQNGLGRSNIIGMEEVPNQSTGNIKDDIQIYLDRLSRNNMDAIIVDLTHPDIGIPVVRVIVPKLISYSGSHIKESVFLGMIEDPGEIDKLH